LKVKGSVFLAVAVDKSVGEGVEPVRNVLEVKIKTLTPLWTGGVDRRMDRIHETGILGSLRWWYEAVVRGLGGTACDPSQHTCNFDHEKYRKSRAPDERQRLRDAGLCDVCQVFGATGWQRRFRLEILLPQGAIDVTEGMFPSGRIYSGRKPGEYRAGGWFLVGGYYGELVLRFIGDKHVLCCEVLPTLQFMEKWGALGAKTSLGYGVFRIEQVTLDDSQDVEDNCRNLCATSPVGHWWWDGVVADKVKPHEGILPALSNMFFARVRFRPDNKQWWEQFPEIKWLAQGRKVPQKEAIWLGDPKKQPPGPYEIQKSLPMERIKRWVECNDCFPLAPILKNFLRYKLLCSGNGESDWCKFIFGTVRGQATICGYCGHSVNKEPSGGWRCPNGGISLASTEVVRESKRIQSKIRISWAYKPEGKESPEWEIRIWGWLPRNNSHQNIPDVLRSIRQWLEQDNLEVKSPDGHIKVTFPKCSLRWWPDQTDLSDAFKELRQAEVGAS